MNEGLKTWLEREIEKNYFNFLFVKERGEELRRDDIVRLESLTECLVIVNEAEKELKDKSFEAVGDFKRKVVDLKNIDEVFNGKAKNGLQEHKNGKEETLGKSVSYADTPNTPAGVKVENGLHGKGVAYSERKLAHADTQNKEG